MKILVLSDSHSSLRLMRQWVAEIKPDVIVHLGDYFSDGQVLAEENPRIPVYQVPGNCDKYRLCGLEPETRLETIGGVRFLMTHGHLHHVKQTLYYLAADARAMRVDVALFGHTHEAYCHREEDGLWLLNPGSCGYGGGSGAILRVEDGKITDCRIWRG